MAHDLADIQNAPDAPQAKRARTYDVRVVVPAGGEGGATLEAVRDDIYRTANTTDREIDRVQAAQRRLGLTLRDMDRDNSRRTVDLYRHLGRIEGHVENILAAVRAGRRGEYCPCRNCEREARHDAYCRCHHCQREQAYDRGYETDDSWNGARNNYHNNGGRYHDPRPVDGGYDGAGRHDPRAYNMPRCDAAEQQHADERRYGPAPVRLMHESDRAYFHRAYLMCRNHEADDRASARERGGWGARTDSCDSDCNCLAEVYDDTDSEASWHPSAYDAEKNDSYHLSDDDDNVSVPDYGDFGELDPAILALDAAECEAMEEREDREATQEQEMRAHEAAYEFEDEHEDDMGSPESDSAADSDDEPAPAGNAPSICAAWNLSRCADGPECPNGRVHECAVCHVFMLPADHRHVGEACPSYLVVE